MLQEESKPTLIQLTGGHLDNTVHFCNYDDFLYLIEHVSRAGTYNSNDRRPDDCRESITNLIDFA